LKYLICLNTFGYDSQNDSLSESHPQEGHENLSNSPKPVSRLQNDLNQFQAKLLQLTSEIDSIKIHGTFSNQTNANCDEIKFDLNNFKDEIRENIRKFRTEFNYSRIVSEISDLKDANIILKKTTNDLLQSSSKSNQCS